MHDALHSEDGHVALERTLGTAQDVELVALCIPMSEAQPLTAPKRIEELIDRPDVEALPLGVVVNVSSSYKISRNSSQRALAGGGARDRDLLTGP